MIPIYRAKSNERKNTYVEGFLIGIDEELNLCTIRTKEDYIGGEICHLDTLSINFPNMINIQGNKIFASLQEDGKGGDILFDMEYEYALSFDGLKFKLFDDLRFKFAQTDFNDFDNWEKFDIIGVEE